MALAHYSKRRGMLIFARDGGGFDICLADGLPRSEPAPDSPPSEPAPVDAGRKLFGHLQVFTIEVESLRPGP